MSRSSTLILLGVLVMLAPYSGLPIVARTFLTVVFGAVVLGIGIWLRAEAVRTEGRATPPAPAPAPASETPVAEPGMLEMQREAPAEKPEVPHTPSGVSPI